MEKENTKLRVGIVGYGTVGNAMRVWLHSLPWVETTVSDPGKDMHGDVYGQPLDAVFVCVPVPNGPDGKQDAQTIVGIVRDLKLASRIWIRSTVTPSTLKLLQEANPKVEYMPEFLTERTARSDARYQKLVFTGGLDGIEFLKKIFPGRDFTVATSMEACLAKLAHNVFGALKVAYFNCVHELCRRGVCRENKVEYSNVRDAVLASGYVNACHTQVPGPDGKSGYGGKCFPENVQAALAEFSDTPFADLVGKLPYVNRLFRGVQGA